MSIRSVFIGFKYPHHGDFSGYDRIADYVDYDLVLHADRIFFFRWLHRFAHRSKPLMLGRFTICDPLQFFYRTFRVWARWRCAFLRGAVVHFAYPETGLIFHSVPGGKDNCYVASLHLPPDTLYRLHPRILGRMKELDHIILMSEDMFDAASSIFPQVPMTFLPHGVDTEHFRPEPERVRDIDILMLGNWLRDFGFARNVFEQINNSGDPLRTVAVALPSNIKLLEGISGVECRVGVSDKELLEILQRSRLLFLPLLGLTANNAILEAAACGCRICIALPDASYAKGYFQGFIDVLPWDAVAAARELRGLAAVEVGEVSAVREFALQNYAWEGVAASTEIILNTLKLR